MVEPCVRVLCKSKYTFNPPIIFAFSEFSFSFIYIYIYQWNHVLLITSLTFQLLGKTFAVEEYAVRGSEVFVGGLPHTITESKMLEVCYLLCFSSPTKCVCLQKEVHLMLSLLLKTFSPCGEIVEIRLIKDHKGSMKVCLIFIWMIKTSV